MKVRKNQWKRIEGTPAQFKPLPTSNLTQGNPHQGC